jgi:cell division protein FtsB
MRILAAVLGLALILLQYRLWLSDQGLREVSRLQAAVDAQASANREQAERNRQLVAEVTDLKVGLTALEERARSELGMVGNSETFYQVVTAAIPDAVAPATAVSAHAAPATAITARAAPATAVTARSLSDQ